MATIFDLSATVSDGVTTSPTYTAKKADVGIQGAVSVGPMSLATTIFSCVIQLDRGDGNGWVDVGGLSGTGGLTGPRGGPYDQPVTCTATTFCGLSQGWKVRAVLTMAGSPPGGVPVSFVGTTF